MAKEFGDKVEVKLYSQGKDCLLYTSNLVTVHINHQLRGDEAVNDEEFSKDFANSLGVKCISFHMDVEEYAKEHKISVEDAGRRIR